MLGFIVLALFLLALVLGIIKRNQKPADPECDMCQGSGIVSTKDYNDLPCYDWCECTYKNPNSL
jgi:hypothetical protein